MAKIPFTKLGLSKNSNVKTFEWNEQNIEVKQYLSVEEKLELISRIVNQSHDSEFNFANPIKIKVFTSLEIMYNYTNINFTEKQKTDFIKLYDLLESSGLLEKVISLIPEKEYENLVNSIQALIKSIYDYQNSVLGILDTIKEDYSDLNLDASDIQQKIANPDNLDLLKNILTQLG